MKEKEIQENGKVFALSLVLFNMLILTAIGGVFWLVQVVLAQINQLNALLYGFRL
jgi:ABC-type siderophore export system fused ATPase/permease subunit